MDVLIILGIIYLIYSKSAKSSNQAKQAREERMKRAGSFEKPHPQTLMEQVEERQKQPKQAKQSKKATVKKTDVKSLGDALKEAFDELKEEAQKQKQAELKKQLAQKHGSQKKQTLMEEHVHDMTPVKPSVKAAKATVKPVRTVFDDPDHCEHRIDLNPNIHYQGHNDNKVKTPQVEIHPDDSNEILKGIIWSEVLGKPKALRR